MHPRGSTVGHTVDITLPTKPPERKRFDGEFVSLHPLNPERDADGLYRVSHGDAYSEALWTYMAYGPFADLAAMTHWMAHLAPSTDPFFLTVYDRRRSIPVGMASFLNIEPAMARLELGNIWYSPIAQRGKTNTETVYLMLQHAFDELGYRRVEWKCDHLNEPSRRAALRLGFQFEGIFRQHMIIKGRNRDTAWYAMMDHEWPEIRRHMNTWLYQNPNGSLSLTAMNDP